MGAAGHVEGDLLSGHWIAHVINESSRHLMAGAYRIGSSEWSQTEDQGCRHCNCDVLIPIAHALVVHGANRKVVDTWHRPRWNSNSLLKGHGCTRVNRGILSGNRAQPCLKPGASRQVEMLHWGNNKPGCDRIHYIIDQCR